MEVSNCEPSKKINGTCNLINIEIPQVSSDPSSTTATNVVHQSHSVLVDDEETDNFLSNYLKPETIDFITKVLAEFIGTGLLLFLGCMGCVTGLLEDKYGAHLNSILGFGLVVMLIIQIFGCVSGAHLNPSVTVAAFIYNKMTLPLAGAYIVAQILGAFVGFGLLKVLTPIDLTATNGSVGMCTTALHASVTPAQGFFVEFIITGVLILVNCGVWDPRNAANTDSVSIRFGLTVAVLSLVAGPYTGASMNPARSLAPAVWNGYFTHHWIYWVAPLSSSIISAFMFKVIFRRKALAPTPKQFEEFPLARGKKDPK